MKKMRILLANAPRMMRDVVRNMIQGQADMDLVGEVLNPVEVLVAVREREADAVILALEDHEESGLCSHLVVEYPNLTILGLAPDGKTALIRPRRQVIIDPSEDKILNALREAIRAPCSSEDESTHRVEAPADFPT